MKRADFYVLPSPSEERRQQFLGKLLEKILSARHQIYLQLDDSDKAQQLSRWLWNANPESFFPNRLISEADNRAPLTLGWPGEQSPHQQVVVNFSSQNIAACESFERVVEIVIQTPQVLAATRERYKQYQQAGFDIHMNDMRKKPAAAQ